MLFWSFITIIVTLFVALAFWGHLQRDAPSGFMRISISKALKDPSFNDVWNRRREYREGVSGRGDSNFNVTYDGFDLLRVEDIKGTYHSANNVREWQQRYQFITPDGLYQIVDVASVMIDDHLGITRVDQEETTVYRRLSKQ
jgi:hypothetical protein